MALVNGTVDEMYFLFLFIYKLSIFKQTNSVKTNEKNICVSFDINLRQTSANKSLKKKRI